MANNLPHSIWFCSSGWPVLPLRYRITRVPNLKATVAAILGAIMLSSALPARADPSLADLFPVLLVAAPKGLLVEAYHLARSSWGLLAALSVLSWGLWLYKRPEPQPPGPWWDRFDVIDFLRSPWSVTGLMLVAVALMILVPMLVAPKFLEPSRRTSGAIRTDAEHKAPRIKLPSPDGNAWPKKAGDLQLPQLATNGRSVITVTNMAGSGDSYIKLCNDDFEPCAGLRHAFVPRGSVLILDGIPAGTYRLRYRPVNDADLAVIGRRVVVPDNANVEYLLPFEHTQFSPGSYDRVKPDDF